MANTLYNRFLELESNKTYGWDSGTTVRAMLVKDSSTYVPDKDHTTVQDLITNGLVEADAAGYSRQTVSNKIVYNNSNTDTIEYRCDNINFGDLAAGQTIKAIVLFIRTGASDAPANDIPIAYIDTAAGGSLPMTTGGGAFIVNMPSTGIITKQQGT